MNKKRIILSVCAAAMAVSLLMVGCGGEKGNSSSSSAAPSSQVSSQPVSSAVTEGKLTDGYYKTDISGLPCFIHFSEDNTYYGYFFDGGVTDAGTYEVVDKELDYYETYGEDEQPDESSKKTASQVIVLTSYQEGQSQEIAFDGDKLCDFTVGGMAHHAFMEHDAAFAYNAEEMEPAIVVRTLYFNNDSGMTLTLYHNRTFVDYTGDARVGGTWDPADNGYTLTAEDGTKGKLTIDGETASYELGGNTVELTANVTTGAVTASFESADPVAITGIPGMEGPTDCAVKLVAYDDGTMELIANIFDNEVIVDKGTYTADTSASPIPAYAFKFDTAGEIAAEPDYASATESSIVLGVTYTATDAACSAEIGGNTMDLALSFEAPLSFTFNMGG